MEWFSREESTIALNDVPVYEVEGSESVLPKVESIY
jgi:hypothetical protein